MRDGSIVPQDNTGIQSWEEESVNMQMNGNWEFDYKPPDNEVVREELGKALQEVPKVPQDPPEDEVITKQTEDVEGEKSTAS